MDKGCNTTAGSVCEAVSVVTGFATAVDVGLGVAVGVGLDVAAGVVADGAGDADGASSKVDAAFLTYIWAVAVSAR